MKKIVHIAIFLMIAISILLINPEKKINKRQYHSSQLQIITVRTGDTERMDYLNENGELTIAADVGYARRIITEGEKTKLERYYNEMGEPIRRSSGYYAILREYDDLGNNIRNTYLDQQGEPVVTLSGYAIVEREYNQERQLISKRYFNAEGDPTASNSFEHGQINEYNEDGKVCKIVYFDASENPVKIKQGYAIIRFNYYISEGQENGKVESEFYFDEVDNPISLSLGQYGVHKEYDKFGREAVLTYLDADGNLMVTNKGYTTVVRTFQANNYVATERYLDINGTPFSLSEGQYGVETINGQTVYLDESGNEQFNIKNLLYNQSRVIIVVAMFIVLLSATFNRSWNVVFAVGYVVAIAYLTLMFRESDGAILKLEPFWSYRKILTDSEARADILKNIWLFIPLGAILYRIYPNAKVLLIPVGLSILIEAIQYFAGTGFCELDDVISNGLGGAIGYGMGCQARMIRDRFLCKGIRHVQIEKDLADK